MLQRDLIKDEIERLGRVLGKMITMLLKLEGGDLGPAEARRMVQEQFRDEFDLELDQLLELDRADLITKFDELNLQPSHIEQLGDLLASLARKDNNPEVKDRAFRRALVLYDLAGERSGTYSMTRADKEAAIWAELL